VSVLGTVAEDPSGGLFHWPLESAEPSYNGRLFLHSPGSRHYGTPRASGVKWGDGPTRPIQRRRLAGLRCREYPRGTGILTGFPSASSVKACLRTDLPPADDRCRGTLALSAEGILTPLGCYYRRDLHSWPVHWTSRPSFRPATTPAYRSRPLGLALGYRHLA
jgi:hypothetical protein